MLDGNERHRVGAKEGFEGELDLGEYAGPGGVVRLDVNPHCVGGVGWRSLDGVNRWGGLLGKWKGGREIIGQETFTSFTRVSTYTNIRVK